MTHINFTIAPHSFLGHIKCHTGYCGSNSAETLVIYAGTDIDALASEMAQENAQSYSLDGKEVCSECGNDWSPDSEGSCWECDSGRSEWEENEAVAGYVAYWKPSNLGSCYAHIEDILNMLEELGAVKIGGSGVVVDMPVLEQVIDLTGGFTEFCTLLLDAGYSVGVK